MSHSHHDEPHFMQRTGWLRASVLGANDGIISVTSLVMGMAASGANTHTLLIACLAGLISGATSMAAGEYVSVQSQKDIEHADLKFEASLLEQHPHLELEELTTIYIHRGLTPELAKEVAIQLTEKDALEAHARDEIGIIEQTAARPVQAALSSALSFSLGALCPMLAILFSPSAYTAQVVLVTGIISLMILGALSSYFAGTSLWKGSLRITVWGILAMAFSSWIGSLFHVNPM
ncbi:VIT1/CCC1 transporter family protein [Acinetobacter ursingii]|uniref:VIT1/CCC1 transporter family protein n=1 Tax=Acinetobacter ursingii TaxID=108980 RepID=UPI00124FD53B|nr:VIT family protein [Acinetobacter ursingii]